MIFLENDSRENFSSHVRLRVQDANGVEREIECPSVSKSGTIRRIVSMGGRVLSQHEAVPQVKAVGSPSEFSVLLFSQELKALLEAGLNLGEALGVLCAKERSLHAKSLMREISHCVNQGRNFSDALAMRSDIFSDVYVATVRAAEKTGNISQALGRYVIYEQQFEALRKKIISAAIYPAMLLVVGGFVTLFLLGYVVPRFSSVYESSGRDIPLLSKVLMNFGKLIYQNWQIAAIALICAFIAMLWLVSQRSARKWAQERLLSLPWLQRKAEEFRLARFYRAVSLLLSSGIPLPKAMGMVTGLLSPSQQHKLVPCRQSIEQGQSLSVALVSCGLADQVAESLIKVGERSGQMAEMLERTARFADDDFARWIDWASRLLEPVLMAIIGLVIGAVVVLMYLPIFELAGSLQ